MPTPQTSHSPSPPSVSELVQRAARSCADHKADRVVILDLHGVSDMTDYFVIASGTSDTHVRALAHHVIEELAAVGQRPYHEEGLTKGRWVLLDYVDFVVHLFHPTLRDFYQLERLWGDAESVPVQAQGAGA
jgi:ribosome-associated protein